MPNMDDDHPGLFDAVEDQIVAVDAVADAVLLVSRDKGEALGVVGEAEAGGAELTDEGEGAIRVSKAMWPAISSRSRVASAAISTFI